MTTHMTPAEARTIATNLMTEHGLIQKGWHLTFGTAKKQAGYCSYSQKRINLSRIFLEALDFEGSMDTIVHEVAHALTPGDGHGRRWMAQFRALGGNGKRTIDKSDIAKPEAIPQGAYEGTCPKCARVIYKHRMPSRISSCGKCRSVFDPQFIISWKKDGQPIIVVDKPRRRRSYR